MDLHVFGCRRLRRPQARAPSHAPRIQGPATPLCPPPYPSPVYRPLTRSQSGTMPLARVPTPGAPQHPPSVPMVLCTALVGALRETSRAIHVTVAAVPKQPPTRPSARDPAPPAGPAKPASLRHVIQPHPVTYAAATRHLAATTATSPTPSTAQLLRK